MTTDPQVETSDFVSREEALAALERVSLNFDGDAITALYLGSQAVAALPAIPLDHEAQSLIEKELRRANAHVEDTKRRGEAEMCARWVNYADGLQFALEKMAGALPVLETKKETT